MAMVNKAETYVVVLGDGEMQEGQIYESLMTIKKYNIKNMVNKSTKKRCLFFSEITASSE